MAGPDELRPGLTRWLRQQGSWGSDVEVGSMDRPAAGHASNTFLVDLAGSTSEARIVLRLPPDRETHLGENLLRQTRVQNTLATAGIPAPSPTWYEPDERWLGTPFLVMPWVAGHVAGEAPTLDDWITGSSSAQQASLYEGFVDALAAVHRFDLTSERGRDLTEVVRGVGDGVREHVAYWREYLDWATDGAPPPALVEAIDRSAATAPEAEPPASLLWGDVRLGNAIFDDDRRVVALIDWETACIGPAELDVGYWLGLESVLEDVMGTTVVGFPGRTETVARYEERLGRPLVDLGWFEALGLLGAACISARLTMLVKGRPPSDRALAAHPVLVRIRRLQHDER